MSRHRNVRQLIDEDYYDDYYDDDGGDGYDDYDDYAPKQVVAPPKKKAGQQSQQQQQQKQQSATQSKKPSPAATAAKTPEKKPLSTAAAAAAASTATIKATPPNTNTASASKNSSAGLTVIPSKAAAAASNSSSSKPDSAASRIAPPSTAPPKSEMGHSPLTIGGVGGGGSITAAATTTAAVSNKSQIKSSQSQQQQQPSSGPPVPDILLPHKVAEMVALHEGDDVHQRQQQQQHYFTSPPLTVVVLGHVDAGKSTLTGHLLYLSERRIQGTTTGGATSKLLKNATAAAAAASSPFKTPLTKGSSSKNHHNNNNYYNNNNNSSATNTTSGPNFAWLLDEDEQERLHGVTMDIGTKQLPLSADRTVVLQDAPGHADYVPAMITGTANAEGGLLVIDATDFTTAFSLNAYSSNTTQAAAAAAAANDSFAGTTASSSYASNSKSLGAGGGQTKEHLYLARGLGVQNLVVCLNKMDVIPTEKARQETYQKIISELSAFLQKIGYQPAKISFIPVSAVTGMNLMDRSATPNDNNNNNDILSWYKGPTVFEALDKLEQDTNKSSKQWQKQLEKPFRMIVTDVWTEGTGTSGGILVRGKVASGWIRQGENHITVLPAGDDTTITKLSSLHNNTNSPSNQQANSMTPNSSTSKANSKKHANYNSGTTAMGQKMNLAQFLALRQQYAVAGEMIDIVLTGLADPARISTGSVLARSTARPVMSQRCLAKIVLLETGNNIPVIRGAQAMFHMHHLDVPCHLSQLIRTLQPDGVTTLQNKPRALAVNANAVVEITLLAPICMEAFTDCRALGRFVLRRSGESIAVGRIEQVLFPNR